MPYIPTTETVDASELEQIFGAFKTDYGEYRLEYNLDKNCPQWRFYKFVDEKKK